MRRGWLKRQADLAVQDIEQWPEWMKREAGMRRGKADRFERQMEKAFQRWANGPQEEGWLTEFIKEMRREHRAVVRLLNKDLKECEAVKRRTLLLGERTAAFGWQCRADQCQYILDRLIARAR